MKSHVRVAVIGGGVVGCSVLYHLTKLGWRDVVLLERDELTSGSTWHAAGGMHTLNSDPNVAKLQDYTIRLYNEIEAISGQSCGIHLTGGLMLAGTPERLDFLKTAHARGRLLGLESEFVSIEEAKRRHPLIETKHFLGALFDPYEGHIDPSGVTHAYAKAAQKGGAEVDRFTPVVELHPEADGGWLLVTPKGTFEAEIVVNAAGLWAREVGRLVGLELPVLAMEHHYLVTEDLPEIVARTRRAAACDRLRGRDLHPPGRQGPAARHLREGLPALVAARPRRPISATSCCRPISTGSRRASSSRSPTSRPSSGRGSSGSSTAPSPSRRTAIRWSGRCRGCRNFYVACGVMAGFSQGGGVGLTLAELDRRGRSRHGRVRDGHRPLRRLRDPRLHQRQSPRELQPALFDHLPQRGAAGRKAAQGPRRSTTASRRRAPCSARASASSMRSGSRQRAAEPTRYRPSAARTPTRPSGDECRAVRARRRPAGDRELRQIRDRGAGCAKPGWTASSPAGCRGQGRISALPDARTPSGRLMGDFTVSRLGGERFMIVGSRRRRALPRPLVRATSCRSAGSVCGRSRPSGWASRSPGPTRASCSRGSPSEDLSRAMPSASSSIRPIDVGDGAGAGRPGLVHRRARLRDLRRCRLRARALRRPDRGRRRPRARRISAAAR